MPEMWGGGCCFACGATKGTLKSRLMDFFDLAFWKDFASNALATFLGAVMGMLSALWVNRRQQRTEGKNKKKDDESVQRNKPTRLSCYLSKNY